jgi:sugar/nucleoside kinase (ribokinase family)
MDILGIGNALLDIFWFSDDESALALGLHPNKSAHMESGRLDELLLAVQAPIFVSGGSASNSVKAAAALGIDTAFIGCTGTDDRERDRWARLFTEDLASFGVRCELESRNEATGRCLVIHMPGNLKSIACAPGAAPELSTEQITEKILSQAKMVLLDGQTLWNEEVAAHVISLCEKLGIQLALDAGSADVVRSNAQLMLRAISGDGQALTAPEPGSDRSGPILFLNDDEALALALALGTQDSDDTDAYIDRVFSACTAGLNEHSGSRACIVHKRAERGARAWQNGMRTDAPTIPADPVLDDTGAGDAFNGAFLAARLKNLPLAACLEFANAAARTTLSVPGSRFDRDAFSGLARKLAASAQ